MVDPGRLSAFSVPELRSLVKWIGMKGYSNSSKDILLKEINAMINCGPPIINDSLSERSKAKEFLRSVAAYKSPEPSAVPEGWTEWREMEMMRRQALENSADRSVILPTWYRLKTQGREIATIQLVSPANPPDTSSLVEAGLNDEEICEAVLFGKKARGYIWVAVVSIDDTAGTQAYLSGLLSLISIDELYEVMQYVEAKGVLDKMSENLMLETGLTLKHMKESTMLLYLIIVVTSLYFCR